MKLQKTKTRITSEGTKYQRLMSQQYGTDSAVIQWLQYIVRKNNPQPRLPCPGKTAFRDEGETKASENQGSLSLPLLNPQKADSTGSCPWQKELPGGKSGMEEGSRGKEVVVVSQRGLKCAKVLAWPCYRTCPGLCK